MKTLTLNPETKLKVIISDVSNEKCGKGKALSLIMSELAKVEQRAITTTIERMEGIIGADEPVDKDDIRRSGYESADWDRYTKNQLKAEQRQALSTLKQELLGDK
jgi:hypothetical protein